MRRVPWNLFFAAMVFGTAGWFLVYHLVLGDLQDLSIFNGDWWQWVIAISLLVLSAIIALSGHVETVTFSLTDQSIEIIRYLPLWAYSSETHKLTDVKDVMIVQKGRLNRFENTVRYYVTAEMRWGRRIKMLETRSLHSVKAKVTTIRDYLRLSGDVRLTR